MQALPAIALPIVKCVTIDDNWTLWYFIWNWLIKFRVIVNLSIRMSFHQDEFQISHITQNNYGKKCCRIDKCQILHFRGMQMIGIIFASCVNILFSIILWQFIKSVRCRSVLMDVWKVVNWPLKSLLGNLNDIYLPDTIVCQVLYTYVI